MKPVNIVKIYLPVCLQLIQKKNSLSSLLWSPHCINTSDAATFFDIYPCFWVLLVKKKILLPIAIFYIILKLILMKLC